jgi:TetR/AcrR family transcriptional regulator, mexJK operon transcriptional repressor
MPTPYKEKHHAIIDAAIAVFLEKGFLLTSMDAIAAKAGISKVTVYNHFADKKQLFEHVMAVHCANLAQGQKLISYSPNESPQYLLETYAHRMVDLLLDQKSVALMRLVIGEAGRFSELSSALWPHGKLPMHEEFKNYLLAEQTAGRLVIENVQLAVHQFFGLIKENLVWPTLMGVKTNGAAATRQLIIKQSVAMFVEFYRVKRPVR